jgi:RNA polymerase sigma factor (sigma-70 family)
VQEAFVRVARRFVHIHDPAAFGAYLRRTVVNLARSDARRRTRERAFLRAQVPTRSHGSGPEPDRSDELAAALMQLPVRQRTAVVLRFYEDLSVDRTADLNGTA